MYIQTQFGLAAFVISCIANMLLIGFGVWVVRHFKATCLRWVIFCWALNFPLTIWINSYCLSLLLGKPSAVNAISLSGIGFSSKKHAFTDFMAFSGLISSGAFLALVLLIIADASMIAQQAEPQAPAWRGLSLIRLFSSTFGLIAVLLSVASHVFTLIANRISP